MAESTLFDSSTVVKPVEYRPIDGFPGFDGFPGYRAGSDGSVWSCLTRGGGKHGRQTDKWRKRSQKLTADGRWMIVLCRKEGQKSLCVHPLILAAFKGPRPQGMECCHNNGNPADNRIENLRWATHQENMDDRSRHGRTQRHEAHSAAKVTWLIVRAIREEHSRGNAVGAQLAKKYGLSKTQTYAIIKGTQWKPDP